MGDTIENDKPVQKSQVMMFLSDETLDYTLLEKVDNAEKDNLALFITGKAK